MTERPPCPKCACACTYEDAGGLLICPECAHEFAPGAAAAAAEAPEDTGFVVRDSVVVFKDLKVKGSPSGLKAGTKVKNIRLVDADHNIDCRIEGIGAMGLKSEFVRKA